MIHTILSEWPKEVGDAIVNTRSLCVALFATDKTLLYANQAMSALLRENPSETLINPTFDQLISADQKENLIFEGYVTLGDYDYVNASISARVYRKGNQILIMGGADAGQLFEQNEKLHQMNRDVANLQRQLMKEKAQLEKTVSQLNKKNEELKTLNATKDKFFSIIAHDLRSPFNAIIGFSDLLVSQVKEQDYEGIGEHAEIVQKLSMRTMNLLSNLIAWSRSQTGRLEYKPVTFNLSTFLNEIILMFADIARQKSIHIRDHIPDNVQVHADQDMLGTVLRNLISNAIKYTRENGVITVSVDNLPEALRVSVSDNGVGIPEDKVGKLFDLTRSFSTVGTHKEKGTGLGLILCRNFVARHGGEIRVESEEGEGSTFYFTIPNTASKVTEQEESAATAVQ